ncbi:unnamed protein product [Effrenium voratum]|uniref:Uncharacterized protein n=1 Tax=Effrenium voratum TaxID=2562239 RepID=A0AA36IN21_9DINO|nr:unnamed protein product [Effrenium voratum]
MMFEELKVEDGALFKEVMRRAREKLKEFPDNLTKFPILLLEVPRTTTEGINLISSTAKDVATDKIGSAIHVIVSASSAAVALAFDAGGTERQEDIWVGDLTEEEAKEFLALHGHENKWEDFVDACERNGRHEARMSATCYCGSCPLHGASSAPQGHGARDVARAPQSLS